MRASYRRAAALVPVFFSAAAFAASLAVVPAFDVPSTPAWLAVSAAGAGAVGASLSRLPRGLAAAGSGLALVGLLAALGGGRPAVLWRSLLFGPDRLLTQTLPLGGGTAQLAFAVLAVWVCAGAAVDVAARSVRSGGTAPPRAFAWPLGLFVGCFAAASDAPMPGQWARLAASGLLVALAAAAVAAPLAAASAPVIAATDPSSSDVRLGTGFGARGIPFPHRRAAAGVIAAAGVAAVVFVVPGWRNPLVVHRRPPTSTPSVADPLAEMATLRSAGDRLVLTLRTFEASSGYIPVALLDRYDGASWRFAATFAPTGGLVPPNPTAAGGASLTQRFVIDRRLPVPLLPAADRPVAVSGLAVSADASTGMLIAQSPSRARRYTVISRAPLATLLELPAAGSLPLRAGLPASGVSQAAEGLPPGTAADVAAAVDYVSSLSGSRPAPTVAFLQEALEALRSNGDTLAGPPPPGSGTSLSDVIEAVTVQRSATPEQYATFYALVVRWLGLPARVATGFRISAGGVARAGTYRVTGREAWAWVEIPVRGVGWVVSDPSPASSSAAKTPPPQAVRAATATTLRPQAELLPRRQAAGRALAPPGSIALPTSSSPTPGWVPVVAACGGLAVAVLAWPAQAAWRRASRRRRRRAGDPRCRAVGAWLELLDTLHRAGLRPSPAATSSEVAADAGHHFGPDAVAAVARVGLAAEAALFCSAAVSESSAGEAWSEQARVRRRLLVGLDVRARLGWFVKVGAAPALPAAPAGRPPARRVRWPWPGGRIRFLSVGRRSR
jgi:hypothetical protein